MKIGDTIRVRKTDITGEIVAVFDDAFVVIFPEYGEPTLCYPDEIELFPNDDILIGCVAQSSAEAGK